MTEAKAPAVLSLQSTYVAHALECLIYPRDRLRAVMRMSSLAPALMLLLSGCTLAVPGCRNRDVRAAIEKEARDAVASTQGVLNHSPEGMPDDAFVLRDTFETGSSGDTRSCSGTLMLRDGSSAQRLTINYEVIDGEDGKILYRWDQDGLLRTFVRLPSWSWADGLKPAAPSAVPQSSTPPSNASETSLSNDDQAAAMKRWNDRVHTIVVAQAGKLTDMPSGTQAFEITVDVRGRVEAVMPAGRIADPALVSKASSLLRNLALPKPPNGKSNQVKLNLVFF